MRYPMAALAFAFALLLTACSGGDEAGDISSGQDLADAIGCTDFSNDSEEMFVAEGGTCQLDGEEIWIYYFADNDARDSYVEIGSDFGGNYLVGDGWVVDAKSATLDKLAEKIGGERP